MNFFTYLNHRGLVHNSTPQVENYLIECQKNNITPRCYAGFDPSSASLQVGNLVAIMLLRRAQLHGVQPIVLLGGATGLIGDPSGKKTERTLMEQATAENNVIKIKEQISKFLDFSQPQVSPIFVNNYDWFKGFGYIEFLRDVGKFITINYMIAKDSVKLRMETGISYAEFGYMLMQGYDYLHLFEKQNCSLQIGGSDQWGNITTGIELIRRKHGAESHAISTPLLTDSAGNKLGKSEAGALYLEGSMTSPFQFYQYWLNLADSDVINAIKFLTLITDEQIATLEQNIQQEPEKRLAQKTLAKTLVEMVHGSEQAQAVIDATEVLFTRETTVLQNLNATTLELLKKELTHCVESNPQTLVLDLLVREKMFSSKSEAKRMIQSGGISINRQKISDEKMFLTSECFLQNSYALISIGKNKLLLVTKT